MHALLLLSNTFSVSIILFFLLGLLNYTDRFASIEPSMRSQSKTHIGFIIIF